MYTKNNISKFFILILIVFNSKQNVVIAQNINCGSVASEAYMKYLLKQASSLSQARLAAPNPAKLVTLKTLSITAWIIKDSLRNTGVTPGQLNAAIASVNKDFAPMNMAFKICNVKYIDNSQYDSLIAWIPLKENESRMYAQFHDSSTINMYFATKVNVGGALVAGYAHPPGGKDIVAIAKANVGDKKTISHELGHYFGLLHTFETSGELVDRKLNCSTSGDFLCDTEADPFPFGTLEGCEYVSGTKDPSGTYYTPPIGNIMSYYPPSCKCGFSPGQFTLMTDVFLNKRNYLY